MRRDHLGHPHKTFGPTTNKTEKQIKEEFKTPKFDNPKSKIDMTRGFYKPKELPKTITKNQNEN